ncbi:MAG: cell division protein FtsQ/DivIB [Gemmatimonadaceae bacterium]
MASSPWWGPPVLSQLSFFNVRSVEVHGTRFVPPSAIMERLNVDTNSSVWADLDPLVQRVRSHPQVRAAEITRRLPGTLVVRIDENLPVALVPSRDGLVPVDASGNELPIDPSRADVDLPIMARHDTTLLGMLADVRARFPDLFARISEVYRRDVPAGDDEVILRLSATTVRAMANARPIRFAELLSVERDLARRQLGAAEIDLRFRDQVIARLR